MSIFSFQSLKPNLSKLCSFPGKSLEQDISIHLYPGTAQEIDNLGQVGQAHFWGHIFHKAVTMVCIIENASTPVTTHWLLLITRPCETVGFSGHKNVITWLSRSARIKMID